MKKKKPKKPGNASRRPGYLRAFFLLVRRVFARSADVFFVFFEIYFLLRPRARFSSFPTAVSSRPIPGTFRRPGPARLYTRKFSERSFTRLCFRLSHRFSHCLRRRPSLPLFCSPLSRPLYCPLTLSFRRDIKKHHLERARFVITSRFKRTKRPGRVGESGRGLRGRAR